MLSEPQTLVFTGPASPAVFRRLSISGANSEWADEENSTQEKETLAIRHRVLGKAGQLANQHNVLSTHSFTADDGSRTYATVSLTMTASDGGDTDWELLLFRMLTRQISLLYGSALTGVELDEIVGVPGQFKQLIRGEP